MSRKLCRVFWLIHTKSKGENRATKRGFVCNIRAAVGTILLLIGMAVSPLGAQNEVKDAEFRTITCRQINVVDGEGTVAMEIVTDEIDGGRVTVFDKDTMFALAVMGTGGYGKESVFPLASMGYISSMAWGATPVEVRWFPPTNMVALVGVSGKGNDTPRALMGVDVFGHGMLARGARTAI